MVSSLPESCEIGEIGGGDGVRASRYGSSTAVAASRIAIAPSVRGSWGAVPLTDLEEGLEREGGEMKQQRRREG